MGSLHFPYQTATKLLNCTIHSHTIPLLPWKQLPLPDGIAKKNSKKTMASSKSPSSFMRHRTKPSASKADKQTWYERRLENAGFGNRVDFVFRKFSASMGASKRWAKPRITCRTNIGKMMWKYVKRVAVFFVTFPFLPLNSYPPEAEWCVQNVAGHVLHKSPAMYSQKNASTKSHTFHLFQDASGISNHMQTLDSHQRNSLTNSYCTLLAWRQMNWSLSCLVTAPTS